MKSKAKRDRESLYEKVREIYQRNNRFGSVPKMVGEVSKMPVLAKIYLVMVINFDSLKRHSKVTTLYDSVVYAYLHSFKGICEDGKRKYTNDLLVEIRRSSATVGRCVRFVIQDHPEMFSTELITESTKRSKSSIESEGNSLVMIVDD